MDHLDFPCVTGSLLNRIALWECFRNAIPSLMRLALGSIHRLIEAGFFFSVKLHEEQLKSNFTV